MNSIDRIIFKNNDIPTTYLISNSIEGYLNTTDGKFYKESSYTTEITGAATMLYLDKATNKLYRYNENNHQYIAIAGGGGSSITVDDEINSSSTNPVQNKVIYSALENKADSGDLGTAAAKNIPASGNASTTEVVMGNDTRLTDARNAADVSAWAKAANKPSYNGSEITTSTAKSGTAQQSITNTVASGTSVDNVVGTMLNNDKTLNTEVNSLKETLTNFEEYITGEVVDSEPYVLRQGKGNLADMDLVGGSLAWNQLVNNGNFASTSSWTAIGCTFSVTNKVGKFTASEQWGRINGLQVNIKKEHKYFLTATIKGTTDTYFGIGNAYVKYCDSTSRKVYNLIFNASSDNLLVTQVGDRKASGWTEITVENFMCIDLTALFGSSTIADYIYSLEQATAGAGVAWFRKYFPNAYYGYQSGKIESVNPSKRVAIGKNLFDVNSSPVINCWINVYNNDIASGDAYRLTYIKALPNTTYTASKMAGKTFRMATTIAEPASGVPFTSTVADHTNTHLSITTGANDKYLAVLFYSQPNGDTLTPQQIMETLQIEIGAEATAYEPYQSSTYAFDSSKQLRGIPKLVDNKLSYDGDIYKADGTVTRKYGIVDLGSINWTYNSEYARMGATPPTNAKIPNNTLRANAICGKYPVGVASSASSIDKTIALGAAGVNTILVYDSSYTDAATFKTAMSGVYFVYELATPTTESASPYQNPQRAFTDGTEEFIDAGVTGATRDVSIPVGNNTTYQLNETLPPIEDYVDGAVQFRAAISALGDDESGRTTASRAYTAGEFFYKDEKMYKVLASIAQGATFTVGTNCQQTTLFAELKALAQ